MTINERITELGFKLTSNRDGYKNYQKRNVDITVTENTYNDNYYVSVDIYKREHTITLTKHRIMPSETDKVVKLIEKFIKKEVGR